MNQNEYLLLGEQYEIAPNPSGMRKSKRVIKKFPAQNEEDAKKISKLRYNHVINPELYRRIA